MFQIGDELFTTIDRCARTLHIARKRVEAVLKSTAITSWYIEGQGCRYISVSEVQAALAAEDAAKVPESIEIDGKLCYPPRMIAQQVPIGLRSISYLIKTGKVRYKQIGRRYYVCLYDVRRWIDRDSKIQQIDRWWKSHPGEHQYLADSHDLQRRLAENGINVSSSLVRLWRIRAGEQPRDLTDDVLAWLEADDSRREIPQRQIVQTLHRSDPPLNVSRHTVARALDKYEARHRKGCPFPMDDYIRADIVAEALQVSRGLVTGWCRDKHVVGRIWKDKLYLRRDSLRQFLCFWRSGKYADVIPVPVIAVPTEKTDYGPLVPYRQLAAQLEIPASVLRVWYRTSQIRGQIIQDELHIDPASVQAMRDGSVPEHLKGIQSHE